MATITQAQLDAGISYIEHTSWKDNKVADWSGNYRGECLSLTKRFFTKATGATAPASGNGWGSGWWTTYPGAIQTYFIKEAFVPGRYYPRGSMFVNEASHHIGIFLGAGSSASHVLEQNADPDGSGVHEAERSNSRINGILVPRLASAAPATNSSVVGKTVYLSSRVSSWRCYVPGTHTVKCTLNPAKFGGLSYVIRGVDSLPARVLIDTRDFGRVSLPIDSDATIR